MQQSFVLLGFCVCSSRRFCLGLYIGRALVGHFIIDVAMIFNCLSSSNVSVKTLFYVVIVIPSCINNLIYLPSTGYSEDFVLFNGALHFFNGFKICCLEQWILQDFYLQTKSFYFRITSIKLRKLCRRHSFSKIPHKVIFNVFSIAYHCPCLLQ